MRKCKILGSDQAIVSPIKGNEGIVNIYYTLPECGNGNHSVGSQFGIRALSADPIRLNRISRWILQDLRIHRIFMSRSL